MEMIELNYKSVGAGKPVIIVHGLLGMLDNWKTFGGLLADSHLVFLVDLRNHGRSPHQATMTYQEMSEDILNFMDQHWLHDEVSIIGHSMGGKVAMQLALDHPDRISNLFVVDIAPKIYAPSHEKILSALASVDLASSTSRKDIEQFLQVELGDMKIVGFLMKNLTRKSNGYQWKMNLDAIRNLYDDILGDIELKDQRPFTGSTRFFRGEKSNYITDADIPLIKHYFPQMDLITVPKAGHWVHADNLDFLLAGVRDKLPSD